MGSFDGSVGSCGCWLDLNLHDLQDCPTPTGEFFGNVLEKINLKRALSHLGCAKLFRASSVHIKLGSPQPSFTKSLVSCTSTRSLLEVSILRDSRKRIEEEYSQLLAGLDPSVTCF